MTAAELEPGGGTPRQAAKARTRQRLLAAARQIMAAGGDLSVATAARQAELSIATAYRYYSDVPSLESDAALDLRLDDDGAAAVAEFERRAVEVGDPLERLVIAQRLLAGMAAEREAEVRLYLAKSLQVHVQATARGAAPPPRGSRRRMMIDAALADLRTRMAPGGYGDLVLALTLVMGADPYLTLRDQSVLSGEALLAVNAQAVRDIFAAHMARAAAA